MNALAAAAPLQGAWQLVHGPLAHWAQHRPDGVALQSEAGSWTFGRLHAEVEQRSARLVAQRAPQMLLRAVSVVARGGRFVPPELRAQWNQSRRQRQQP
ncbi:MAG: hypothetical protein L0H10_20150, partial [Comamonas sp.]|nr:hypothetical protein [Comamonas sp.]